ncbi:hypothetical protein [Aerococcus urinaeequi]|uniref:hypothetical protein n=1 Tax=Aerococcus urinaeequi TaxID=51665 RepID=UPI003D6B317A
MLDQNTDRMWFVIGAVIVGAAIIFIANGTMPQIFASVTDEFSDVADAGIYYIQMLSDGIDNLYHSDYPLTETLQDNGFIKYGHNDMGGITITNQSNNHARAKVRLVDIIPKGDLYAVSYDVRTNSEKGAAVQVDVSDINEFEGAIENLPVNTWQEWRPHLVTVRHDGGFYKSAPGVGTKMNFVDFNVILEGHSTVEFRNIVIANVGE